MVDPIARTVLSLMARFGGDAVLVVDSGDGTYDPETSSTVPGTTEYPVRVLAEDYIQKASGITSQSGGLIQTGDKKIFIQPSDDTPVPKVGSDYIIFEGRKWVIHTLKDYNPSGTNSYLYEVYARQ